MKTDIQLIWEQIQKLNKPQREQLRRMIGYADAIGSLQDKQKVVTEKRFAKGRKCLKCGSQKIIRHGHTSDGVQRYLCRECGKTFVITADSLLFHTRKSLDVWQKYLDCMMNGLSIRKSAQICGIKAPTSFQWRHKILDALRHLPAESLSGIIEADETFFPVSYKGNHSRSTAFTMPRPSRRRGHDMHRSGMSNELVCVPCAVSVTGQSYAQIAKLGRVSIEALHRVFDNRIEKKSLICSDEDHSYGKFSKESGLDLIQIHEHRTVKGIYNIQRINSYHSRLKRFINRFHGVSTKYLNNYLAWHSFLADHRNTDDEKELFLTILLLDAGRYEKNSEISKRPAVPVLV